MKNMYERFFIGERISPCAFLKIDGSLPPSPRTWSYKGSNHGNGKARAGALPRAELEHPFSTILIREQKNGGEGILQ